MAIVDQHERFQDRHWNEQFRVGAVYRTSYYVRCDDRNDGPLVARTASILPVMGLTTKSVTVGTGANAKTYTVICSKLEADPLQSDDLNFVFKAEFTTRAPDEADIQPNPLLRKPDVDWTFVTETRVLYEDLNGTPIQSSAGQQYDPPEEIERPVTCLVYQDNVADYDPSLAAELTDSINLGDLSVPVGIHGRKKLIPKWTAYCHSVTASTGFENGVYYMRRRIEIHIKPPRTDGGTPWARRILDQGTYEIVDSTDPPTRKIIKVGNQNTNAPVTLDGMGHAMLGEILVPNGLSAGQTEVILTGNKAVYFDYLVNALRNHNSLALQFP